MQRVELQGYLERLFEPERVRDYCPNGLQVEGRATIERVVCGVTASLALIEVAVERRADAIIVHHGYFWRGEDPRVLATRRARLALLLRHDINLFAYHLPLDLHPSLGNNAQLSALMGWRTEARFGEQDLGFIGTLDVAVSARDLAALLACRLGREPMLVGDGQRLVRRVAWCTGAAQSMFEAAIGAGADVFVSGEISEPTVHLARESGVPYMSAGHHATERYGIRALSNHLVQTLGLDAEFVDIDSPV